MGSKEFGSREFMLKMLDVYRSQVMLIEKLYQQQFMQKEEVLGRRVSAIYPLLFSLHQTGTAIDILALKGKIAECFMLARSVVERIINYLYLLFCEDEEYARYLAYTKQKGFRILNRSITVGNLKAELRSSGSIDVNKEPELKEAVEMFTSSRGREITRWSNKSIDKMMALINEKGGIEIGFLMLAKLGIYDDASEAMHGTLYGSIFYTGIFEKGMPKTKGELEKSWCKNVTTLFVLIGTSIHSLIEGLNKVYKIEDILNESKNNLLEMKALL